MDLVTLLIGAAFYVLFAVSIRALLHHREALELAVVLVFTSTAAIFAIQHDQRPCRALSPSSAAGDHAARRPARPDGPPGRPDHAAAPLGRSRSRSSGSWSRSRATTDQHGASARSCSWSAISRSPSSRGAILLAESRRRVGFPRVRLATAGIASILFGLSIFIVGRGRAARGGQRDLGPGDHRAVALAGPGRRAGGYLAAFVPPRWLREIVHRALAFDLVRSIVGVADRHGTARAVGRAGEDGEHILGAHMRVRITRGDDGPRHDGAGAGRGAGRQATRRSGGRHPDRHRRPPGRHPGRGPRRPAAVPRGRRRPARAPRVADGPRRRARGGGRDADRRGAGPRRGRCRPGKRGPLPGPARGRAERDPERRREGHDPLVHAHGRGMFRTTPRRARRAPAGRSSRPATRRASRRSPRAASPLRDDGRRPTARPSRPRSRCRRSRSTASRRTCVVVTDVTWRHEADEIRDRFIGVLSHELRTPVTSIFGGTQVLLHARAQLDPADAQRAARRRRRRVRATPADDREPADPRPRRARRGCRRGRARCSSTGSCPTVVARERATGRRDRRSRRHPGARCRSWPATRRRSSLVVRNLISNAGKYAGSERHGRGHGRRDGAVAAVSVRVIDDGPGIDAGRRREPCSSLYFRSRGDRDRTGLRHRPVRVPRARDGDGRPDLGPAATRGRRRVRVHAPDLGRRAIAEVAEPSPARGRMTVAQDVLPVT